MITILLARKINKNAKNIYVYINKTFSFDSKNNTNSELEQSNKNKEKITDYYKFMEENIQNYHFENKQNLNESNQIDDINELLKIIKCPMTDSKLEYTEEGLKVEHILYPKRNGMYILKEDEAKFNF